jgi:hypothetical protein|tara:strand:+ start:409 stop:681 length:273 start_codon:yes stop_codon:yes gene_type:complete
MATYPVVNNQTGERKEVVMSVMDWDQWKIDNPDWDRDYSDPSTVPGMGIESVGEWQDRLDKKHPSWKQILKSSEKSAGIRGRLAKRGIET